MVALPGVQDEMGSPSVTVEGPMWIGSSGEGSEVRSAWKTQR